MTFLITLTPSMTTFPCAADETLLSAALNAGIVLPYGCKNGACSTCLSSVESGTWVQGRNTALAAAKEAASSEPDAAKKFCSAAPFQPAT